MKLGLGTVQFGLNYGINNSRGKPEVAEINRIIHCAQNSGIATLDTAADYGDSEEILGKVIPKDSQFQIITKVSKKSTSSVSIQKSLARLNRRRLYGVLIHDFAQFKNSPNQWSEMKDAKDQGIVEKIGFSLYLPEQLMFLTEKQIDFDILQLPYSIFDRRFEPHFDWLKKNNVTIHTRSVFVQGLVFSDPLKLSSFFDPIKAKLQALASLGERSGKSIESLCLNFAYGNPSIDNIIIGVDTAENLQRNIAALKDTISKEEAETLDSLKEHNEMMILPFNWKT